MYSIEILNELAYAYQYEKYETNYDFWYIIDHMNVKDIVLWCTRLTKTKLLSNCNPETWLHVIDIIQIANNQEFILTSKQKRYCVLQLLPFWTELSSYYVI
jgi:hypothetical protein